MPDSRPGDFLADIRARDTEGGGGGDVAVLLTEVDRLRDQIKEHRQRYAKAEREFTRIQGLFQSAIEKATAAEAQGVCAICAQERKFSPHRQIAEVSQLEAAMFTLQTLVDAPRGGTT